MADRLMNIQLQKKKGPAFYDHSLSVADDWLQIGCQLQKLFILLDKSAFIESIMDLNSLMRFTI